MEEGSREEAFSYGRCESYLLFRGEIFLSNGLRAFLYLLALAYCFFGLSAITARFFRSMENVVKQTREVVEIDPCTNTRVTKRVKLWNYAIADIALLATGTSFPQISLATIDAIQNIGRLNAGGEELLLTRQVAKMLSYDIGIQKMPSVFLYGLGPGTLVGSAAFDLFPIHAVCVVIPKAGTLKKISDIGVWLVDLFWSFWAYVWLYIILEVWTPKVVTLWEALLTVLQFGLLLLHAYAQDKRWPYVSIPIGKSERPEDWVPEDDTSCMLVDDESDECHEICHVSKDKGSSIVDIFSIHSDSGKDQLYHKLCDSNLSEASKPACSEKITEENFSMVSVWRRQFSDAILLESNKSKKFDGICLRMATIFWQGILVPWRLLFAFVPPYQIAHGWIAFICSLLFISGIAYMVTKLTDVLSCVTGINPYVIALTALASGTSWPDLVASKIAAERQVTADSAIANITCSNSVNIYIGIGIPWLINTTYNFFAYNKPLYIENAGGLSFSLLVFFMTSFGCIAVLVLRRLILGAELGGPRCWAWLTAVYFMLLWVVFVILSSLKISGLI